MSLMPLFQLCGFRTLFCFVPLFVVMFFFLSLPLSFYSPVLFCAFVIFHCVSVNCVCSVTPLMTLWICCRCYSLSLSAFSPVVAFLTSAFVVNESDLWFLFTRVFTLVFKCRRSQRRPTEPPFHLAFCFSLFFILILLSFFVCIFPFSHTLEGVLDSLLIVH